MAVDYNDIAKEFAQSRKNLKWEEIEYFMTCITKRNISLDSILDVGCGSGRLLESLQDMGVSQKNYMGVDLSQGLLEEANKNFPDFCFQHLDMTRISELNKTFSCVFFIASFHHLDTPEQRESVLKQLYDVLQPGGYVFFTNWYLIGGQNYQKYASCLIEGSHNDFCIKFGDTDRKYHGFSLEELEGLLEKSGFSLVENKIFSGEKNIVTIAQKK